MRPGIYSSSNSNKQIKLNGGRRKGKCSEPPPKDLANSKSVAASLERSSPLFVRLTIGSLFSTAGILFLVTAFLAMCPAAYLISAIDYPNAFHLKPSSSDFSLHRCYQAFTEPWSGEHEFIAIVMRACARCCRDLIATIYRLRVVITTRRMN